MEERQFNKYIDLINAEQPATYGIQITNSQLNPKQIKTILEALETNRFVRELELDFSKANTDSIVALAKTILSNRSLTSVTLKKCNELDFSIVYHACLQNFSLTKFEVDMNVNDGIYATNLEATEFSSHFLYEVFAGFWQRYEIRILANCPDESDELSEVTTQPARSPIYYKTAITNICTLNQKGARAHYNNTLLTLMLLWRNKETTISILPFEMVFHILELCKGVVPKLTKSERRAKPPIRPFALQDSVPELEQAWRNKYNFQKNLKQIIDNVPQLTEINFTEDEPHQAFIGNFGALALAKAFENNTTLENVTISSNLIGAEQAHLILASVITIPSLRNLNLKLHFQPGAITKYSHQLPRNSIIRCYSDVENLEESEQGSEYLNRSCRIV